MSEEFRKKEFLRTRLEELQKESQERIKKASPKTVEPLSLKTGLGIIIIFCLIAFPIAYQCKKNRSTPPTEEDSKRNCAVLAENGVKANLKAPTTVEFNYSSGSYNDYVQLISVTDSIFEVNGTCDAENSFGAKIRDDFTVKIKKEYGMLKIIDVQIK